MDELGGYNLGRPQRGPLDLFSLYLVYFVSFGAFCLSLSAFPESHEDLHGPVLAKHSIATAENAHFQDLSEQERVRSFCLLRISLFWQFLQRNLQLQTEERSIFVNHCLWRFHEVVLSNQNICKPIFSQFPDLAKYEQLWKTEIFDYSFQNRNEIFKEREYLIENDKKKQLIHFSEKISPKLSDNSLLQSLKHKPKEKLKLKITSSFLLSRNCFKHISIIPVASQFYEWINETFGHLLTEEQTVILFIFLILDEH